MINASYRKASFCLITSLLLSGCGATSYLFPSDEEIALRAEKQRLAQHQASLERIDAYSSECAESGFMPDNPTFSNCLLELSIADDSAALLKMKNVGDAHTFLRLAKDSDKALAGFSQLCIDLGFVVQSEPYAGCMLRLNVANRIHIATAEGFVTNRNQSISSAFMMAYILKDD